MWGLKITIFKTELKFWNIIFSIGQNSWGAKNKFWKNKIPTSISLTHAIKYKSSYIKLNKTRLVGCLILNNCKHFICQNDLYYYFGTNTYLANCEMDIKKNTWPTVVPNCIPLPGSKLNRLSCMTGLVRSWNSFITIGQFLGPFII